LCTIAFLAAKHTAEGVDFLQKWGFSLPGPIIAYEVYVAINWASETLQRRLSNASVTLQKRSTSGLHLLLDVFIHCGGFHGSVPGSSRLRPLTPDLPPYIIYTLS
jgi:hypothetical protein